LLTALASPVENACTSKRLEDLGDVPLHGPKQPVQKVLGVASWYSERDPGVRLHTASGKRFDSSRLWAASWDYPFGTRLKVTSLSSAKSVEVVVEDRGPARYLNRDLDLTKTAFSRIAQLGEGLIEVEIAQIPR